MINVRIFDLTKSPFESGQEIPVSDHKFEVRHARNYTRNKLDQCGGHTFLVDKTSCRVYTAKCKYTDKFHKRAGILMAIQKFVGKAQILDFSFWNDGIKVWIDRKGPVDHWFLTANYVGHS